MKDELDKFIVKEVKQVDMLYKKKYLGLCKKKSLIPIEKLRNKTRIKMMEVFKISQIDKGIWGDGFTQGLDFAKSYFEKKKKK